MIKYKIKKLTWTKGGLLHSDDPLAWEKKECSVDTIFGKLKIIKLKTLSGKIYYSCFTDKISMPGCHTLNKAKKEAEEWYYNKIKEALKIIEVD